MLYNHSELRQTIFFQSEGEKGLLDGDPGEKEATNDDNSVIALHPDTIKLLQLSYNTQSPFQDPKKPSPHSAYGPPPRYGPSEASL